MLLLSACVGLLLRHHGVAVEAWFYGNALDKGMSGAHNWFWTSDDMTWGYRYQKYLHGNQDGMSPLPLALMYKGPP